MMVMVNRETALMEWNAGAAVRDIVRNKVMRNFGSLYDNLTPLSSLFPLFLSFYQNTPIPLHPDLSSTTAIILHKLIHFLL